MAEDNTVTGPGEPSGSENRSHNMDSDRMNNILQSIASMKSAVANNAPKNPPKKKLPFYAPSTTTTQNTPSISPVAAVTISPAAVADRSVPQSLVSTAVTERTPVVVASSPKIVTAVSTQHAPSNLAPGNLRNATRTSSSSTAASANASSAQSSQASSVGVKRPRPTGRNKILVSTCQRRNKILEHIRNVPWEWSGDIEADYIPGPASLVLFLSLKYHRLHPEYILNRMAKLTRATTSSTVQPMNSRLRVLLVYVDIENHQDALKELTKISLRQDFTIMLAWSAEEAGRYISELKILESASAKAIQGQTTNDYELTLQEALGKVKGINKNDSLSLVAQFGSLKRAIEDGGRTAEAIGGWGAVKVKKFKDAVTEPFIYNKQYPDRST